MTSYRQIKDSTEFMQLMRELYFRGNKKIEEINVPKMKFLVVTGRGSPESENFVNDFNDIILKNMSFTP